MFFPASGLMAKAHAGRYLKLRFLKILVQTIPRFYLILVMIQSLQPPACTKTSNIMQENLLELNIN